MGHGGAGPPPQGLRDCFIPPDAKPGTGRGSLEPASAGVCGRVVPQRCGNLSLRASSVALRAVLGSCVCRPALLCPPSEGGPPSGHGPSVPACLGPPPCPLPHTQQAHPQQERAPAARAGGRRAPKTSGGGHLLRGVGEVGRCTPSPEIPARPSGSDRLVGRGKPPERWPLAGRGAVGSGEVAAALRPCPFLQSPADQAVPCLARRLGVSDREAAAQRRPRRNPAGSSLSAGGRRVLWVWRWASLVNFVGELPGTALSWTPPAPARRSGAVHGWGHPAVPLGRPVTLS